MSESQKTAILGLTDVDLQYIVLTILVIIVLTIILGSTCHKFCAKKKNKMILKPIQYGAMIVMLSFLLSYILWAIFIFTENGYIETMEYLSFAMGWFSLYIFMFYRLYHTFVDSKYKMSKLHIVFHTIVSIFIPVWYCMIHLVHQLYDVINVCLLLSVCGWILSLIGLLLLIVTFNRNLFNAILMENIVFARNCNIQQSDDEEDEYSDDDEEERAYKRFKEKQEQEENMNNLLSVIARQTVLGSIMIIGMIVFVVMVVILLMYDTKRTDTQWIIYEWILGVDIIINCLCIFFGFKMNENTYIIVFKLCHNRLLWSYKRLATKLQIRHSKQESLLKSGGAATADLENDVDYFMQQ